MADYFIRNHGDSAICHHFDGKILTKISLEQAKTIAENYAYQTRVAWCK
jgi:hypothetical protein